MHKVLIRLLGFHKMQENEHESSARKSAKPSATGLERKKHSAQPPNMRREANSSLERPKATPVLSGSTGRGAGRGIAGESPSRQRTESLSRYPEATQRRILKGINGGTATYSLTDF